MSISQPWEVLLLSDYQSKHQKYRQSNVDYREREAKRTQSRDRSDLMKELRHERQLARPFLGWDTEGTNIDATPFLFGCSSGDYIHGEALGTRLMLDLILQVEQAGPDAIHVIYGGEYDFNMILRELPRKNLYALKMNGKTLWEDYRIEHIPRKWFVVSRNGVTAKIFDVVSFFACPFLNALIDNGIGSPDELELIAEGKADRSSFTYKDIDHIERYWRTEIKLLPLLMAKLRESFVNAGVFLHSWHGPGAVARYMLREHGIKECKADTPEPVHAASRYAFCGGRFESFQAGRYEGLVYNADINSAYPYAATMLPNLATGNWRYRAGDIRADVTPQMFSIHHIRFHQSNAERDSLCVEPLPLFRRFHDDRVQWTNTVTGWYWSPEASNIIRDPRAEVIESWIYEDDGSRPFAWLDEYYTHRLTLQRIGDSTELAFKLGPNSVYGQLAQRAGWERNKRPPPYHQIEWAGYVTSWCRAMVHNAAKYCWERNGLISIDTDGVFSTCPIPDEALFNGSGSALGQWKVKSVPGMLNWQSGVYWIPDENGNWSLKKARGAPKGRIPYEAAVRALEDLSDIEYKRTELIGYRWALKNTFAEWRYFVEKERRLQFGGSEFSKRWHNPKGCRRCRGFSDGTLHDLYPASNGFAYDNHSTMHVLPWESNDHDRPRDPIEMKAELEIESIWT